ncbi:MAG: hypothetical protein WC725_02780 [Patescibacteria group bacterium]|jgi:hypothetical protein
MAKKNKKNKPAETNPMPSLVFHEGSLKNENSETTPNADQIEKELQLSPRPPSLSHLASYNESAYRLMWLGVISVAVIICAMWSWSIYSQLSLVKISATSEKSFVDDTKANWQKAFNDSNEKNLETNTQVNKIKEGLSKLFAGAAASSSTTTSTPGVSSTP